MGGDGTFLAAEREFSGIAKLPVRDSLVCFKCHNEPLDEMLDLIRAGRWSVTNTIKLQCLVKSQELLAANDVVLRNQDPRQALLFRLALDGNPFGEVFIGDGVVVATPFGSTGYYRSVTQGTFEEGIGLALNNCTVAAEPLCLDSSTEIEVNIVRLDAHLSVDNHPELLNLSQGDAVSIG